MKNKIFIILTLITLLASNKLLNQQTILICEEDKWIDMIEPCNVKESYII